MKIRLLKDHELGKAGEEVEVVSGIGSYLVKMKVAELMEVSNGDSVIYSGLPNIESEKGEIDEPEPEKQEIKPANEKKSHNNLPTATKKKGRPKRNG